MDMTETATESPKTRKPAKKRARAKTAKPTQKSDVFAGITPSDCPIACKIDHCVISHRGICAHPYKGGLQAAMQSPEAVRRLNEAKRALGKRKLNLVDE